MEKINNEDEIIEFIDNLSIKKFALIMKQYQEETGKEIYEDDEDSNSYLPEFLAWVFVHKMNRD